MNPNSSPNRTVLERVAQRIEPLLSEVVFVGGQVAELLITDPAAVRVRPTTDVDVIVSAATKVEFRSIEQRLTALGLRNDQSEGAPICRWLTPDEHKVDVMPVNQTVLGFSNHWYPAALERAVEYLLTDQLVIQIPTAPVFLAMKWDAFRERGAGDLLASHDLEDIITVVAARPGPLRELPDETAELRKWLGSMARDFLENPQSLYALQGALPDAVAFPHLLAEIRNRFEQIAALA